MGATGLVLCGRNNPPICARANLGVGWNLSSAFYLSVLGLRVTLNRKINFGIISSQQVPSELLLITRGEQPVKPVKQRLLPLESKDQVSLSRRLLSR
jgi:hypothetical protein